MSQATPDSNPQAGGSQADPVTPNPQVGGAPPSPSEQHPQAGEASIDPGKMREIQRENQALRARLKTVEDAERAAELAKLGDVERLQAQLTEAATQAKAAQERIAQTEAKLLATKLGIINPDLAIAAIRADLKVGKDGAPENAEELLKALIKDNPYLVAQPTQAEPPRPQSQMGATNPGRSQAGATPVTNPRNLTWNDVLKRP